MSSASQGRPFSALDMDDMDCRIKEQGGGGGEAKSASKMKKGEKGDRTRTQLMMVGMHEIADLSRVEVS